jgi:hypothetical protein
MPKRLVRSSLWRVGATALVVALIANVFLIWVSTDDDWFATIIGISSGVLAALAIGLELSRDEHIDAGRSLVLLATFAVFMANLIEFATEDGPLWETKVRQCGFYLAFALLALGGYVALQMAVRQAQAAGR